MANPFISSYTECIQPPLNAVNSMRQRNILEEGVELPTIVIVGDQKNNLDEGHKQADDGVDSWTVDCVCGARDDDPRAHGRM
ncbi:putative dynamin-related protein 4A [Platanthera zijinensis]|uniref:Dynamin-related protein 4A n=1 Tax=Platanthera zijinensis TaxID=2320716 RepID=A0AAP0B0H2_9ASPA